MGSANLGSGWLLRTCDLVMPRLPSPPTSQAKQDSESSVEQEGGLPSAFLVRTADNLVSRKYAGRVVFVVLSASHAV